MAAACALPGAKIYEVAARFSVSISFVDKLLYRQRTSLPQLTEAGQRELTACLVQQPAATLDELRTELAALGGPALSRPSTWRAVQGLGWERKKKVSTPPNATASGS
ncbi:MAG: hypothetical protein EOO56_11410 [Hymenobacter sp.]|nr:MAG: hypothetical protein EOO56_11410 [Hymenobacter sp.]